MSMKITLPLHLELEMFQLEEVERAEQKAEESNSLLYSWKTSGSENWLERGLSVTDVLGIIILPRGLPDVLDMPDDINEDED